MTFLPQLSRFGALGLFFAMWFIDRKYLYKQAESRDEKFKVELQQLKEGFSTELKALKEEAKESNGRWYELGQRMETHLLTSIGGTVEMKERLNGTHSKLDVLLRRGDLIAQRKSDAGQ